MLEAQITWTYITKELFTLSKNIIFYYKWREIHGFDPNYPSNDKNVLNFYDVYLKMVDQQVISVQDRWHYLYWTEKVHNVIVLSGFLELGTGILLGQRQL